MKHRLVIIGYTGVQQAYLDISREEAIHRWKEEEEASSGKAPRIFEKEEFNEPVDEFEFDTEFGVYSAWETEKYASRK